QVAHALGMAASQAAGVVENLPSGAKNIGIGHAARNGLFAALMAARGSTGASAALEGPYGWARACGDALQRERLLADLGEQWEASKDTSNTELEAKVYASASGAMPATDIEQSLARLWQLQNLATIQPLMALVAGHDTVESP